MSIFDIESLENPLQMFGDGPGAEFEDDANFSVRLATSQPKQHGGLPVGESISAFQRFGEMGLLGVVGGGFEDTLLISDSTRASGERGIYTGSIRVDLNYTASEPYTNINSFGVRIGSTMGNARAASHYVFYGNGGVSTYAYLLNFSVRFGLNQNSPPAGQDTFTKRR